MGGETKLVINKTRVAMYRTHVLTMKLHIKDLLNYWVATDSHWGDSSLDAKLYEDLARAHEECDIQADLLNDFLVTKTVQVRAHGEFSLLITKDLDKIRSRTEESFPTPFLFSSLSLPFILRAMDRVNPEVRKLGRGIEASAIAEILEDYMTMVREITGGNDD